MSETNWYKHLELDQLERVLRETEREIGFCQSTLDTLIATKNALITVINEKKS